MLKVRTQNPSAMSASPQNPSASASGSQVLTTEGIPATQEDSVVRLKLRKPKSKKKVVWSANTVDNENMNKKKSKCCCIFERRRQFGESSSDSDDECEHCRGHGGQMKPQPQPPEGEETGEGCSNNSNHH